MSGAVRLHSLQFRQRLIARHVVLTPQRRCLNHFIFRTPLSPEHELPLQTSGGFRLAIKDNIATSSQPTTCASPFLSSYVSPFEATIVTQLRARGAVVVGKTNCDEFGMGSHSANSASGPVVSANGRSAGGSSGGSAVAVAEGEADVALGTDTGGSVRLPAAYTGIVGFKPSYGMLSRHGVVPYANSLDTVGLLAADVGPIADLLVGPGGLYAEYDPLDPTSLSEAARRRCIAARAGYASRAARQQSLQGLTFGVPLEYNIAELDGRIRSAWAAAATRLQTLGARCVPVTLPSTRHALSAYYVIAPAEASSNLAKYDGVRYGRRGPDAEEEEVLYASARGAGFGAEVRRRILLGSYTLSSAAMDNYFVRAQRVRRLVRRDFDRVFALANPLLPERERSFDLADMDEDVGLESKLGPAQVDFLLCPTAPTLPPTLEEVERQTSVDGYMNDVFTVPASLAGLPAISIPMKVEMQNQGGENELDFAGLQLIGQYWDDARLLAVAEAVSKSALE